MPTIQGYNMPDALYYHKEHAWVKVENGKVRVGMNDFYQKQTGDVIGIDLPEEGTELEQDEVCGKLQSSKWVGKLYAPVSGTVAEVNWELEDDSTLINQDPYGKGWVMVIEASDLDEDLQNLLHGDPVADWVRSEIRRAEEGKKK